MKIKSHDVIWIVAIALMFFSHAAGAVPQVPTMALLSLLLGASINQGNVERISFRLLLAGICSQFFWAFSGIGTAHQLNDVLALYVGVCALQTEIKNDSSKWSGLLWVLAAIWLESTGLCSMLPALIIYSTWKGGRFIGYVMIAVIAAAFNQLYYLYAIPLFEGLEYLQLRIRIPKIIKYSVYPVHLMALHFLLIR